MVNFIAFYFYFLANFHTLTSPHIFSIFTQVMSRGTHSEPGLPMRNRAKTLNQNLSIRLILGQRHVRRFYQTSSQESSLAIHPATEICHKISISPSGQHTCDDQLVTCTVTALFIVGTFHSTPPRTLRALVFSQGILSSPGRGGGKDLY